jgi:Cu(I)/Ag(I) efflux system membrane fusion protein
MTKLTVLPWTAVVAFVAAFSFWAGATLRVPSSGMVEHAESEVETYYCSMHPHIRLPHPGKCPICRMDLIPLKGDSADTEARSLTMSAAAMELAEIETAKVRRAFVASTIAMVGKVEFDETKVKTITAWVGGRLDRLYVDYTGVSVNQGDHVADIFSPTLYEAQRQLLEALKSASDPETSSQRLREASTGTLEAVRKRMQLLGLSDEQIAEIEQRKTLSDHLIIRSSVRGVVFEKLVNEGDSVTTGAPLYKVVELDTVWVKLDAYESDLPWLRYGQEVSFRTEAYPGRTFRGTVSFIDWVVDHRTRTIKVRLNVDNTDGSLKPGMFVRGEAKATLAEGGRVMAPSLRGKWISPMHPEILKDGPGSCDICGMDLVRAEELFPTVPTDATPPLIIPASAPLITGRRAVVYVRKPGSAAVFEGRDILLGPRAGDKYVVLEGLREGEVVVTRGNFKIDSSLQIQAKASLMTARGWGDAAAEPTRREAQTPEWDLDGSRPGESDHSEHDHGGKKHE